MVLQAVRDEGGQIIDFRFGMINEAGLRLINRNRDELISKTFKVQYPSLVHRGLFDKYVQVCETGQPYFVDKHYSEQGRWWSLTASPVVGDDGVMLTYLDVTERIKADDAVVQQAQLLSDIMESGPVGLVILRASLNAHGQNFQVERVNSLFQEQICRSTTDLVGQPVTVAFQNARESGLLTRCIMAVELGEVQKFELPYGVNGQRRWYQVSMMPKNNLLILALTDITATRKAQLVHHSQAQLLSSVLDGSQNAIVAFSAMYDAAGQLINFRPILQNAVNRRWMGLSDETLGNLTLLDFFTPKVTTDLLRCCVDVVETGRLYQEDIAHDYGTGPGLYNLSVAKRGDGIVLTVQDKTSEKLAQDNLLMNQRKLEAANIELRRTNDNLQSFTYIASHDLQEPLRKIQSFGDILKERRGGDLGPDVDLLERMQSAASRMSMLIHDLLTYSRLSSRQEMVALVSLKNVITEALSTLELTVTEAKATFDIPELPSVRGDATQLQQLFQNLFANAIKFRKPDTVPHIRIRVWQVQAEEAPTLLDPSREKGYYRIDVGDDGIGFDPKYLDRIFQVFQRLHGKSQYAGTGIGLAICEKVVANHGGAITAASQPGHGATFTIYLPV